VGGGVGFQASGLKVDSEPVACSGALASASQQRDTKEKLSHQKKKLSWIQIANIYQLKCLTTQPRLSHNPQTGDMQ
jgi:hypothetical protein